MEIESELTLLMTGSIDPKGMRVNQAVADPKVREQEYAKSISFYLEHHSRIRRIVFAENSGWPLDRLRELIESRKQQQEVEFCSFSLNDYPREWGKSYGEMLLMDHAFAESRLISRSRYVAKVTGRIILKNLTKMLKTAPEPLDFYTDLRDHHLYDWLGVKATAQHGESRFFVLTPQFYESHFRGKYALMKENGGMFMETFIFNTVKESMPQGKIFGRFRREPQYRGIAGHHGKSYSTPREWCKQSVRGVARRVVPWLWI
jgi:hypothetical protein